MSTHPLDCVCVGWTGGQTAESQIVLCVCVCVFTCRWACGHVGGLCICMCVCPLQHQAQGVGSTLSNSNRRRGLSMLSKRRAVNGQAATDDLRKALQTLISCSGLITLFLHLFSVRFSISQVEPAADRRAAFSGRGTPESAS